MAGGVDFSALRVERRRIGNFCKWHFASVESFRAPGEPWFRLLDDETAAPGPPNRVKHLSTTASCFQSLRDLPSDAQPADLIQSIDAFADSAFRREDWQSEGAAHTYCRVRTLPLILEHASAHVIEKHAAVIAGHIAFAWRDVSTTDGCQGIAEHAGTGAASGSLAENPAPDYPPNAFLTYWGLRTLQGAGTFGQFRDLMTSLRDKRDLAMLWCRSSLASQVALSVVRSERFDPQQLAWAFAALVQFSDPETLRAPGTASLLQAALREFFASQLDSGGWSRGDPLFHYPQSGNAYCYTFETLVELIRPALNVRAGELLRELLRPHLERLLKAWEFAERTRQRMLEGEAGWCSGHHPHRVRPEAWATAAVYSFLQFLRRLVGYWAREAAAEALAASKPRWATREAALDVVRSRGDTWDDGTGWSVGNHLGALFLNPLLRSSHRSEWIDPDQPLIRPDQARGAILFGPPGTGKTTLVEALAGAIGWDYVEVHASHFLSKGMGSVPSQADHIFNLIMELDKCVVLFDEIDELLRDRGAETSDPFGRFLTTSMLPKLAKLWEQRRVLYFVNTNWIDKADPAIKRSQRFDAAICVLPPSFTRKVAAIREWLNAEVEASLSEAVNEALRASGLDPDDLGWFALFRWDQLDEVQAGLRRLGHPASLNDLRAVLHELGKQLAVSDWHLEERSAEVPSQTPFERYRDLLKHVRSDARNVRLLRLAPRMAPLPAGFLDVSESATPNECYLKMPAGQSPPKELRADGWRARGDVLLQFAATKSQV
jgi:predicted ATPase